MGKIEPKIDAELLAQALEAGVAVDRVIEEALRAALRAKHAGGAEAAAQWVEENAEAFEDYNRRIAERGLIGAEFRKW